MHTILNHFHNLTISFFKKKDEVQNSKIMFEKPALVDTTKSTVWYPRVEMDLIDRNLNFQFD